ncbi:hypothetical protein CHARACLAT_012635, partial [Characodon lateralis]|nr:hypothetical protein [Characodon lateralis]
MSLEKLGRLDQIIVKNKLCKGPPQPSRYITLEDSSCVHAHLKHVQLCPHAPRTCPAVSTRTRNRSSCVHAHPEHAQLCPRAPRTCSAVSTRTRNLSSCVH